MFNHKSYRSQIKALSSNPAHWLLIIVPLLVIMLLIQLTRVGQQQAQLSDQSNTAQQTEEQTAPLASQPVTSAMQPSHSSSSFECQGERYCWAIIGNDGKHLTDEREAGVVAKVWSLSWRQHVPKEGAVDERYIEQKRAELAELREAGFAIILSLGFHDTPSWVHDNYSDTYYINQYGKRYRGDTVVDNGDVNLVFNQQMRELVAAYIDDVFTVFGTDFAAVRLGGGRYGELTYPPASYEQFDNSYWAFDDNALKQSPTPDWKPGEQSSQDEARRFLDWYLQQLTEYQNWQITTVRQHYDGPIMMLYPSWGIRPGQIDEAVEGNLDGETAAERNGEIQRGFDFARQVAAINDPNVIVTTTWLDADAENDDESDQRYWSPVKYLAQLAREHPLQLRLYGENTGKGDVEAMELSAAQVKRYGLQGMAWFREDQLFSGDYASLDDYRKIIAEFEE